MNWMSTAAPVDLQYFTERPKMKQDKSVSGSGLQVYRCRYVNVTLKRIWICSVSGQQEAEPQPQVLQCLWSAGGGISGPGAAVWSYLYNTTGAYYYQVDSLRDILLTAIGCVVKNIDNY